MKKTYQWTIRCTLVMGNRYVDHCYPSSGVSHVLILVAHFHRVGW